MAERNDMTAALVTAYTSPQLAAINEYLEAERPSGLRLKY